MEEYYKIRKKSKVDISAYEKFIQKIEQRFFLDILMSGDLSANFRVNKRGEKIDLFERFCLISEIDLFFENSNNPQKEINYESFSDMIDIKQKRKAYDRARKNITSVIGGLLDENPGKNKFIIFCFCLQLGTKICNEVLKLWGYDELYSRNINEGLMIYFLNKLETNETLCNLEELFNTYYSYKFLCSVYETTLSTKLGKEFSDAIITDKATTLLTKDRQTKLIRIIKDARTPKLINHNKGKNDKEKLIHYIECLKSSIEEYNKLTSSTKNSQDKQPALTTTIMLKKINQIVNQTDLEKLIQAESIVWCENRNKPLKMLLPLMEEIAKNREITFNEFAFDIFRFYCVTMPGKEEIKLIVKNSSATLSYIDMDNRTEVAYLCNEINFPRDLTKVLFGVSAMNRTTYLTLLIYLLHTNGKKSIIDVKNIDKYLSSCQFSTLNNSRLDLFVKEWIDNYIEGSKTNSRLNLHTCLEETYNANAFFNDSPLTWN